MKKIFKYLSSAMMVSVMALGLCFSSYANEELSMSDEKVVSGLNSLGIMYGTNDGFNPDGKLTRAEATTILVRLNGLSDEKAKAEVGHSFFDDVETNAWYTGYVNTAKIENVVYGVGDNKFAPHREVTYQEMITMIIRTIGAEPFVKDNGTWPNNYINFAYDNNLIRRHKDEYNKPISRIETARLVSMGLDQNMWVADKAVTTGEAKYIKTEEKLINKNFGATVYESNDDKELSYVVTGIDYKNESITISNIGTKKLGHYSLRNGLREGMEVDLWISKDDKVIKICEANMADSEYISVEEIISINTKEMKVKIDGDIEEFDFSDDAKITINGEKSSKTELAKFAESYEISDAALVQVRVNKVDEITFVDVYKFEDVYVCDYVSNDREKIFVKQNIIGSDCHDIILEDTYALIYDEKGREIALANINSGDMLLVAMNEDSYVIKVFEPRIEKGEIEAKSDSYIKIRGDKFYVNKVLDNDKLFSKARLGMDTVLYLDRDDKILMIEDRTNAGDYGAITKLRTAINKYGEEVIEVDILLEDGDLIEGCLLDTEEIEDDYGKTFNWDKASSLLGSPVRIENVGDIDELVLLEFNFVFARDTKGSDLYDYINELGTGYSLNIDANKITKLGESYRITDDTKVFTIEKTSDSYKVEVTKVNWKDLDDTTSDSNLYVTVVDVNDLNEVKCVYLTGKVSKNDSRTYGIVTDASKSKDYYAVSILNNDEYEEYRIEDKDMTFDIEDANSGLILYNISENDDRYIEDIELIPAKLDKNLLEGKVYNMNLEAETIKISNKNSADEKDFEIYDLAEDFIMLTTDKVKEDSKLVEFDGIGETSKYPSMLSDKEYYGTVDAKADKIYFYVAKVDNIDKVVAVIYVD